MQPLQRSALEWRRRASDALVLVADKEARLQGAPLRTCACPSGPEAEQRESLPNAGDTVFGRVMQRLRHSARG